MLIKKYDEYTIAEDSKICVLQNEFDFYILDDEQKNKYTNNEIISSMTIGDSFAIFLLSLSIIIISFIVYLMNSNYRLIDENYLIATVFLLINILIHEFGHISILKLFYREARIKIGFKLVFIFPAFYVDTSFSYFLPKYKKITVYLAGTLFNSFFILLIYLFFPDLLKYCYIIIANMLVNFVPIIKSDGYYSFKSLLGKYSFEKSKSKNLVEDFIRGFLMWCFMLGISYIF